MTRAALLPTAALVLALFAHAMCVEEEYFFKYDPSKEALSSITKAADTSTELSKLLQQYNSDNAEECKEELAKQSYTDTLEKYLKNIKSQIVYIDKSWYLADSNCGTDNNCKQEVSDDNTNDLSALQSKAKVYIAPMKQQLLKKQKDFMDQCVQQLY